jgi:hypothetical protein
LNKIVAQILAGELDFNDLEIEEQLSVVADLVLHYALLKVQALKDSGKTRVDQSVDALEYKAYEDYWTNVTMNLKKIAELETTRARRGI